MYIPLSKDVFYRSLFQPTTYLAGGLEVPYSIVWCTIKVEVDYLPEPRKPGQQQCDNKFLIEIEGKRYDIIYRYISDTSHVESPGPGRRWAGYPIPSNTAAEQRQVTQLCSLKLFSSFAYLACRSQILSQILDNT
jgi:hypothetical protein